ncbi:MAG: HAMP domain-containing sensor histidine kinase [Planctomycetota bacterium]|nr:HAMP domain-containing sensor histidine kinase [Planctomycetota bacterium]
MSLQTRFAILLGLLALTMGLILTTALSFGGFLERELVRPFERTTGILRALSNVHQKVSAQAAYLARGGDHSDAGPEASRQARLAGFDELAAQTEGAVMAVRLSPGAPWSVGVSAIAALEIQSREAVNEARRWLETDDPAQGARAVAAYQRLRDLIQSVESRVLADAPTILEYGDDLRRIHRTLIYAGTASSVLFAVLCVILFRRWVITPARELRLATVRIGEGDFAHRVPVRSDDELGKLSGEVNRMAELVDRMQRETIERERLAAIGEIVRRLAHNLRNPLAAIRGLAELTRRSARDNEGIRADQTEIIASVDRFNRWLTDLLEVTSPVNIVPDRVEIGPWIDSVAAGLRPLARMRGVELVVSHGDPTAIGTFDPRHVEHAVVAIVTNAIQASKSGGRVWITTGKTPTEGWELVVRDEGAGIPSDMLEKIFRPYFTTKRDGTGIGLAIAQQVVTGHGGRIRVESSPGQGTSFFIWLPEGPPASHNQAQDNQSAVPSQ